MSAELRDGLLRRELFLGLVAGVSAASARVNLTVAGEPSGSHFEAARYGRGEVGELVLIEGQLGLVLARLIDVSLPAADRKNIRDEMREPVVLDPVGILQFLGSVQTDTLRVSAGVASYPRLGDRVYAAPHAFVAQIPHLLHGSDRGRIPVGLVLGHVHGRRTAPVTVRPEKLLGRHCAVLGATGGGKSWTVARLVEQCVRYPSKVILLDATGEYWPLDGPFVTHRHLGAPIQSAKGSIECSLPASEFQESDFLALFEPSGKVQAPKLREAIRSLRLVKLEPKLAEHGLLKKHNQLKAPITSAQKRHAAKIEDPTTSFDVHLLPDQLSQECVWDEPRTPTKPPSFGDINEQDLGWCVGLRTRIVALLRSAAFAPIFQSAAPSVMDEVRSFLSSPEQRLLRICLGGVSYEYRAREFIVNTLGRALLGLARQGRFASAPLVVVVDEAHNFLGRSIGQEDATVRLDAFELIAREGRKYGLNLCLATQRPRDLTEGVLSQMGTLIVHRLTNDHDREVVERACGEVDRSATAFLANLRQGEAVVLGVDFPIPLTILVARPDVTPASEGPNYQEAWGAATSADPAKSIRV